MSVEGTHVDENMRAEWEIAEITVARCQMSCICGKAFSLLTGGSVSILNVSILWKLPVKHTYFRKTELSSWVQMGYCEYPVWIWPYSELWILYATISDRLYVIIPRPDVVEVKVSIKSGFFPLLSLHCLCFCVTTKQDLSSLAAGTGSAGVRNVPERACL